QVYIFTSPGVCGTKASVLPVSVLWSRIAFMSRLSGSRATKQVDDCSRGLRNGANALSERCEQSQLTLPRTWLESFWLGKQGVGDDAQEFRHWARGIAGDERRAHCTRE